MDLDSLIMDFRVVRFEFESVSNCGEVVHHEEIRFPVI